MTLKSQLWSKILPPVHIFPLLLCAHFFPRLFYPHIYENLLLFTSFQLLWIDQGSFWAVSPILYLVLLLGQVKYRLEEPFKSQKKVFLPNESKGGVLMVKKQILVEAPRNLKQAVTLGCYLHQSPKFYNYVSLFVGLTTLGTFI